jgi:3-hydroxyacyl-[acyl-carrier-protein] dehydratase
MRWMWIDRFTEFVPGERAVAIKNVSLAEEHLHDHFEAFPVHPPSLMIEGMAQTGGILVGQVKDFKDNVVLAKITRAEINALCLPGDQITYEAVIESVAPEAAATKGTVYKNGEVIGGINLMFSYANKDAHSTEGLSLPEENFVFTGSFERMVERFLEVTDG